MKNQYKIYSVFLAIFVLVCAVSCDVTLFPSYNLTTKRYLSFTDIFLDGGGSASIDVNLAVNQLDVQILKQAEQYQAQVNTLGVTNIAYSWTVNGQEQVCNEEIFVFKPVSKGTYIISVYCTATIGNEFVSGSNSVTDNF